MHDLIIVGAGSAGCVLANRLTESGRLRVLLIEAGGKPSGMFVKMPAGFAKLFKSKLDWNYVCEPQSAAAGRQIYVPRGRMLGGSSNMNAQIHQWCHPADFAQWVEAGASGWSWSEVAPVFAAQERWLGPDGERPRGRSGPMVISPNRNVHALTRAFIEAARATGMPVTDDYNGGDYEGASLCQLAHMNGRRYSIYDAFLKPAVGRRNLEIITGAQVTRVIIENGRATGVVLRRGNVEQTLNTAAGGVMLAGGAFASPQLLMQSGIGPAEHLRQFGIPVIQDAPEVGANLQDHPLVGMNFSTGRTDTYLTAETIPNLMRYLVLRNGLLASNAVEAIAFTRSRDTVNAPDLELIFVPFEWRNQGLELPQVHAFGIAAVAVSPRSRGRVALKSADPLVPPAIDFGLLTDPDGIDEAVLLAGLRLVRRLAATAPLASEKVAEILPGEAIDSDSELRAWLNTQLQTVYHPTSTCRMGTDERAVVDPQLRVNGVEGLWVVDASVMPSVPRGHPNAVVAMIAERAAGWIEDELRQ